MEINVDAKVVEQAVADAVVNSAIGAKIKLAVAELLGKGWDNPIDKAVQKVIGEIALVVIREEYGEQIKAAVRAKMTDETVEQFMRNFWDEVLKIRDR
jgi:hypothetical protein